MARQLFQVEGGYSDGNISYLSGAGAPGGDASFQDAAPVGSIYEDTTSLAKYRKITAGTGTAMWKLAVSASDSTSREVNQVAHGLAVGNWVIVDSANGYIKAQANDPFTSDVVGIVTVVSDVDNFTLVTAGYTEITSVETNGSAIFLDQAVAGAHTITKPGVGVQKNLGLIVEGLVFVAINITIEISPDDAPGVPWVIVDGITTLTSADSVLVDDKGGCAWAVQVDDNTNKIRYACVINAAHDGNSIDDATEASHSEYGIITLPSSAADPAGLAIGVGLVGAGATQEMQLQIASTNAVSIRARRMSY